MSATTVARRYALALYEEAEQREITERVDEDLAVLGESIAGSRELERFFASPIISREKKAAVIGRLFEDRLHPLVVRFLRLLVNKEREELVPGIVQAYRRLRDERLGIVEAEARSAAALSEEEVDRLESALAATTGRKIRLSVRQDPALIGGLVVRIGDRVYDGSVRHQLALLRAQLERGSFLNN